MNINEDKFANKSAEEIISDMLTQHKNNSKEALEHIQDILKDDGLTLSKDTKDNLQKAATMLSDKGLKEGWFSKKKEPELVEVHFEMWPPFKKEPVRAVTYASSLDDPQVIDAIKILRKRHPHSTIYIKSELGDKKIREAKDEEDNEDNEKSSWLSKTAKKAAKHLLKSDITKNIAAIGLAGLTGISPVFTKTVSNAALGVADDKLKYKENTSNKYKVNLYNESGVYSCYTGSLPIALTLVEKASNYKKADVLFNETVLCSYNNTLKEWATPNNNALKEDIDSEDDVTNSSYVDLRKDITDLDERTKLILCHLNPNLLDRRKTKWHNTLLDEPKMVKMEDSLDSREEVLIVLDGIENEVNHNKPDQTQVSIMEKIPYRYTERGIAYKNGEKYVITVKQFKDILQDPENAEQLEKFEKTNESAILNDDLANYFLEFDKLAKQIIDARYPEWEADNWDKYNLGMYTLPERGKIYQAWKDVNRDRMYQQARELTPEEVNAKFGLPKLKEIIASQKEGKPLMTAFENTKASLPLDERDKLDNALLNLIANSDTVEDSDIKKVISYYGAKNQLNKMPGIKDKLYKIEQDLNDVDKEAFESELENLIKTKYIDDKKGLPTIVNKAQEAIKDVNALIQKYSSKTNASTWNKEVTAVKGNNDKIKNLVTTIKNEINAVKEYDPKVADNLLTHLKGNIKNWQEHKIVGNELINNLSDYLNEMREWVSNFESEYTGLKNTLDKTIKDQPLLTNTTPDKDAKWQDIKSTGLTHSPSDEAQLRLDTFLNTSRNDIRFRSEKDHDEWLDMLKSVENPNSKSTTDRTYWTAIKKKIGQLYSSKTKQDVQAADGYSRLFNQLVNDLDAKQASSEEIEVAFDKFLSQMKDETKGFGTNKAALASVF